jgi:hypothetical protein
MTYIPPPPITSIPDGLTLAERGYHNFFNVFKDIQWSRKRELGVRRDKSAVKSTKPLLTALNINCIDKVVTDVSRPSHNEVIGGQPVKTHFAQVLPKQRNVDLN